MITLTPLMILTRKRPETLTVHDTPCFTILIKTPFHKLAINKPAEEKFSLSPIYIFDSLSNKTG